MKTYLTRREAAQKYKVSIAKLRRWEAKGSLRRIDAYRVDHKTNKAGPAIQWVYDEAEIEKLVQTSPPSLERPRNVTEAKVFDLFARGKNLVDVVRQTKLPLKSVRMLRDAYVQETGGMFVPEYVLRAIRKLGIQVESPEEIYIRLELLLKGYRQANFEKGQLEQVLKKHCGEAVLKTVRRKPE
ncbi:MAG: hypothetical protein IPM54_25435 [Polyangiaceae bacterium]|nr:hypothetical protein [Polyangiaceae bacterium]